MKYELRWISTDGKSGRWTGPFATRQEAEEHAALRQMANGLSYTVEEIHDASAHGSMAAHHVEILRERVKELEALVEERWKAVTDAYVANHGMAQRLAFALQLGGAMREAMRTGEWRAGHDKSMANSAVAGWDRWKGSLAKAHSVPASASEAPGEGGDSDRRRLEALERWLRVSKDRMVWADKNGYLQAGSDSIDAGGAEGSTLAALADKLAERGAKP